MTYQVIEWTYKSFFIDVKTKPGIGESRFSNSPWQEMGFRHEHCLMALANHVGIL